jgi:hypothetical protein
MILDQENLFDTAAAVTATGVSTNVIDLVSKRDIGGELASPDLQIIVKTGTAFLSTGSSTLAISVQGSTDNSSWDTYATFPAIAKASLVANTRLLAQPLPRVAFGGSLPRYLRLAYTVGVADFTAGTLTAALVLGTQSNIAYPAGINPAT